MTAKEASQLVPCWFSSKKSPPAARLVYYATDIEPYEEDISTDFIYGYIEFVFVIVDSKDEVKNTTIVMRVADPPGYGILTSDGSKNSGVYKPSELLKKKMIEATFEPD